MLPESMERMGCFRIWKEAAQLLRHHFRLLLPFFLAFYVPASFLFVFYKAFLEPQSPYTNVLISAYTVFHGKELEHTDNVQPSLILGFVVMEPMSILNTLGVVAFTYIVDYIYSDLSDDDAITRRVFKLLPRALLRVFVTLIWVNVMVLLLTAACALLAYVLLVLYSVVTGVDDPSPVLFFVLFYVPLAVGSVALSVVFALVQFIAVLEQGNYGRKALKQSRRYARGRAWTIFCVVVISLFVAAMITYCVHAVATAGLSLATKIVAASMMSVVFSFLSAYVALVGIVMYFVCKSGSDVGALPVAAAENPYRPIDSGSTQIGEP